MNLPEVSKRSGSLHNHFGRFGSAVGGLVKVDHVDFKFEFIEIIISGAAKSSFGDITDNIIVFSGFELNTEWRKDICSQSIVLGPEFGCKCCIRCRTFLIDGTIYGNESVGRLIGIDGFLCFRIPCSEFLRNKEILCYIFTCISITPK